MALLTTGYLRSLCCSMGSISLFHSGSRSMSSIYNKIHRLKRQPGWSWEHFHDEINSIDPDGISPKLLQNYYRSPHKKPTPHVAQIIEFLHHECFPAPFPEEYDRLMHLYRGLRMSRRYLTKENDTKNLQRHVEKQLEEMAENECLGRACLHWLLGNIEFDRIAPLVEKEAYEALESTKQLALGHYREVISALEAHNHLYPDERVTTYHLYRVHYNMLACYLNAVTEKNRSHDAVTLQYIRDSGYLERCKEAIAEEPFQWSIALNGLRFSSLLEDEASVKYFFDLLIAIHPRFVDLSYEPYNQLSISVMEDYRWAIKNVLTPAYLSLLKKRLNSKMITKK